MRTLLSAALTFALPATAPSEIVYIPEGKRTITPRSHPKGIAVNLPPERGEAIAAAMDAELQQLRGGDVKPWFDLEHSRRAPATGYPTAFRYEPGKGIMCSVEWSRSGKEAIEGRDVGYFSPEFYLSDEGVPDGIPSRGPLGGLVAEPAFRDIGRIAAGNSDQPDTAPDTMNELVACGLLTAIEAARADAGELARTRITAMQAETKKVADLEKENGELKTKVEAQAKKRADDLVEAAIADGRILAKDEAKANFYRRHITAGDADAEAMLKDLEKVTAADDLTEPVIRQGGGNRKPTGTGFEARARAIVTAGQADNLEDAFAIVANQDPKAYNDYLATLG